MIIKDIRKINKTRSNI